MRIRITTSLSILALLAVVASVQAHVLERPAGDLAPEFTKPGDVIRSYLKAVDRGELRVFDQRLERSMIVPKRVDYSYTLDNRVPTIKVYSKLKQPIPAHRIKGCEVRGVSSVLNVDGQILETEAHVWPR